MNVKKIKSKVNIGRRIGKKMLIKQRVILIGGNDRKRHARFGLELRTFQMRGL